MRANISRETASRIENGDAAVAIGQIVRYLDVIAPGADLSRLYETQDAAVAMLESSEKRQRANKLSTWLFWPKKALMFKSLVWWTVMSVVRMEPAKNAGKIAGYGRE